MKKKIIIALVILSVVVLAIALFFLTRHKPVSMEKMFPSGADVYVRFSHVEENFGKFSQSDFGKSLSSIDILKVLEHNGTPLAEIKRLEKGKKELQEIFENPLARKFFSQELALGLYGKNNEALFAARLGFSLQMAELAVSMAHQWSDDITTTSEDYKGVSIAHVHFKKKKMDVEYVRIHDVFFAAFAPTDLLHKTIDVSLKTSATFSNDPNFLKTSSYLYAQGQGLIYIRISRIHDLLWDYVPFAQKSEFERALGGSSGLKSYVISVLPGETIKAKMLLSFDPIQGKGYWQSFLSCSGSSNETLKFIPHNVVAYHWGSCYDFDELLSNLKLEESSQADKKSSDKLQQGFKKVFKFALSKDVLPFLGSQAGWYLNDVDTQGAFPYPRAVVFIKITNRPNIEHLITQMTQKYSGMIQEEEYQKNQIHYISLPLGANMDPGYMFLDHYLLVGSSRQLLKTSSEAFSDSNQSIQSQDSLKELNLDGTTPAQGIVFIKINDIARQLQQIAAWYNKVVSSQIEGSKDYEQGIKEKEKELDEAYTSQKNDLALAEETLKKYQVKANSDIPADERTENQTNIEHILNDIKGMEEEQATYIGQKENIKRAIVEYRSRLAEAKQWLFNYDELFKPFLKSLEVLHDMGIKFQSNNNVSQTEILIK